MKNHIIYLPGVGDHRSYGQDLAVKLWRPLGLHAHYMPLEMQNHEGFDRKVARLTSKIDNLHRDGYAVSLAAVSAAAPFALAAYAIRPELTGVVTIAGKIHGPETIREEIRRDNPDFYEGILNNPANIQTINERADIKNILCIYAKNDLSVPPHEAQIEGSQTEDVPGWNHKSGVFFGVVLGAPTIANFIKSRA